MYSFSMIVLTDFILSCAFEHHGLVFRYCIKVIKILNLLPIIMLCLCLQNVIVH